MILSFRNQFPSGEYTEFPAKIWAGIKRHYEYGIEYLMPELPPHYAPHASCIERYYENQFAERFAQVWTGWGPVQPKLHTIREDKQGRWKPGMMIHPVLFNRSKNQFQFAPVLICKGVQRIFMTPSRLDGFFEVTVGNTELTPIQIHGLALNDGFDTASEMERYFFPDRTEHTEWSGWIIHWSNLKY